MLYSTLDGPDRTESADFVGDPGTRVSATKSADFL